MINIGSIDSVLGTAPTKNSAPKARTGDKVPAKNDTVDLSVDAHRAITVYKILSRATTTGDVRPDAVDTAREHIASGAYRAQGVVQQVAASVSSYL